MDTAAQPAEERSTLSMKELFEFAAKHEASDLLITIGAPPTVRIDGELRKVGDKLLTAPVTHRLIWSLLNETQQEVFERQRELDFSLALSTDVRFRANVYYQKGAVSGAFRLIPRNIPSMKELGLPPITADLPLRTHGLILLTGPTGSGKSTSMASMIDVINETRRCHIVTVEDPIEYIHRNRKAIIDQREVYADTLSFSNALKYVLRQDPDVILVGEMRDVETIAAALTAAETGHLVFATLHTNDSVQAIDRIVDVFPPHQQNQVRTQLAFSLIAVLAQRLIPKKGGKGRVMAMEVLVKNHAVANHIRENKTHQTRSIMEAARGEGMITMDHRLKELYEKGEISFDEAARHISSAVFLKQLTGEGRRAEPDEAEEEAADHKRPAPWKPPSRL